MTSILTTPTVPSSPSTSSPSSSSSAHSSRARSRRSSLAQPLAAALLLALLCIPGRASAYFQTSTVSTSLELSSAPPAGGTVLISAQLYPFSRPGLSTNGETVTFYSNNIIIGISPLAGGIATLSIPTPPVGTYAMAIYAGDAVFSGSTSNSLEPGGAPASLPTSLGLRSSTNGTQMSLAATLFPYTRDTASTDGQPITFYSDGVVLGTGNLYNGAAILNAPLSPAGVVSLAIYPGGPGFSAATSNSTRANSAPYSNLTSLGLQVSATDTTLGTPVTFTSTLYPWLDGTTSTDGETVTFFRNDVPFGTAVLRGGVASLTTSSIPSGKATLVAVYPYDPLFTGATSTSFTLNVTSPTAVPTTLTLLSAWPRIHRGHWLPLTATLKPFLGGGNSTNGELVTFSANSTVLGTAPLLDGSARFVIPRNTLPAGEINLTASFAGDHNFAAASSSFIETVISHVQDEQSGEKGEDHDGHSNDTDRHDSDHHDSDHDHGNDHKG